MSKNKPVALVTGAAQGIGKSVAIALAHEGYNLILTCKTSIDALELLAKELTAKGILCLTCQSDVASYSATQSLFEAINAFTSHLDLVVNNAGISYVGLLTDMSAQEWQTIINTNLTGLFHTSKWAVPKMVQQKKGIIINLSSIWGNQGASCEVAYSASKGGVNAFTKALAKELAPSHIRVNAIACGVIDTSMNAWLDPATLTQSIGLSRLGTPKEIADAVVFLASDKASYITGQILTIDGGYLTT